MTVVSLCKVNTEHHGRMVGIVFRCSLHYYITSGLLLGVEMEQIDVVVLLMAFGGF